MTKPRKNEDGEDELDSLGIMGNRQALVSKQQVSNTAYRIWLDEEIKDSPYYREALETLDTAGPGDFVYIHIDTVGGSVGTAVKMINAIRQSEAEVLGVLENKAYSAGSLILLACPQILIKPYSTFMAHSISMGAGGDLEKIVDYISFIKGESNRLIEDIYGGFLTKEEITAVKLGHKEVWLKDYEIMERLDGLAEYRRLLADHEEDEAVKVGKPSVEKTTETEDVVVESVPVKKSRKPRTKRED